MAKRSRILRIGKWSGLLACLTVLALWLVNLRYAVSINLPLLTFWMGDGTLYFSGPRPLSVRHLAALTPMIAWLVLMPGEQLWII